MRLFLQSKFRTPEISTKRTEMIKKEKLHIKDGISYERFQELYNKYGEGLEEKDFAYAFLDIDDLKHATLVNGKSSQTTILAREYVSNEEFQEIRAHLIDGYGLNVVSYNKSLELYEKFGDKLSFKLFSEEILGIPEKTLKSKNLKRYPDREIPVHFEIEPGEFAIVNGTQEEIPMYVLNPLYIKDIRNRIVYEVGMQILQSIDYEKFSELYERYGTDMPEVVFAQEVLDIGARSLNRMKSPKKFSTVILQNVEVPKEYIMSLREKIALIHKLEGGQFLEYSKIHEFHKKYGPEFTERYFAVEVLDIINENYRPEGENDKVAILNTRVTNYENLRNKIIRELNLHYDDMIDYEMFTNWHQKYAPNMPEVVFAGEILDISKSNFREVKNRNVRARILLNAKLPSKTEIAEIRKRIILENKFRIKDEIEYQQVERLHALHGGIMSIEMFAVDVLLMNQQGFKVIQRDYEENKDKKDAKFKKAQVLLNYEIPLSELEELKERMKRLENLYEPKLMSARAIEDLYEEYGGVMHFTMFLQGILGVNKKTFENVKYEKHHETLVHIRERLNEEEIKELKQLLSKDLSEREISTQMEIPTALLRITIKALTEKNELSEENMLYERYKVLKKEGKNTAEILGILKISKEEISQLFERYKIEKEEEAEKERQAKRARKIQKKEDQEFKKLQCKVMKILEDYKYNEKNVETVKKYIRLCEEKFVKAENKRTVFSDNDLLFLAGCMEFIVCDYNEIITFTRICIGMNKYQFARSFISENMSNSGISKEEKEVLRILQKDIHYLLKKEEALRHIENGEEDINWIASKTGVKRADIIDMKNGINNKKLFLRSEGKRPEDDGIAI